ALRKTITSKSLQLPEYPFCILATVSVGCHSLDQLVAKMRYLSIHLESSHAPAQLICLRWRKPRSDNGDLHSLFLEQGNTQRTTQDVLKLLRWVFNRFLAVASPQIRVHHITLNGTWPHNRHLDDQVVESLWPQSRQHRHLRPTFDLKYADGVCATDHLIHNRIILWNISQCK